MSKKLKFLKVRITNAKPQDSEGIGNVLYRSWLATYPNKKYGITRDDIEARFIGKFTPEYIRTRASHISDPNRKGVYLVAKEENKVIGLCRLIDGVDANVLHAIYLLPGYQRKGIGTRLWKRAKKSLDPSRPTIVCVALYNKRAISFYERHGFEPQGKTIIDEKFRMKSGAIIMQVELRLSKKRGK